MPNYEPFTTVYYRQTDVGFRQWLVSLWDYVTIAVCTKGIIKIDEELAMAAYMEGKSAPECIHELHQA